MREKLLLVVISLIAWQMQVPVGLSQQSVTVNDAVPPEPEYEPDQDRALRAVRSGKALPLETIIERNGLTGRVVGVKLTSMGERLVYELSVRISNGQVRTALFDALSGAGL